MALEEGQQARIQEGKEALGEIQQREKEIRTRVREEIQKAIPDANTLDKDYVFITYVMNYLPHGLIGLLLAVVFSAAMSSTASELNSLASTTVVDIYRRSLRPGRTDDHYVTLSKYFTAGWAVVAMIFASLANQAENLIQFVNIIGSLFYGTILGIFLCAFYIKFVKSEAVLLAAIVAEFVILLLYKFTDVAFLLYNIVGTLLVVTVALLAQTVQMLLQADNDKNRY